MFFVVSYNTWPGTQEAIIALLLRVHQKPFRITATVSSVSLPVNNNTRHKQVSRLVLGLVTFGGSIILIFIQAHSAWPSLCELRNEYRWWSRPPVTKKRQLLRSGGSCNQGFRYTGWSRLKALTVNTSGSSSRHKKFRELALRKLNKISLKEKKSNVRLATAPARWFADAFEIGVTTSDSIPVRAL